MSAVWQTSRPACQRPARRWPEVAVRPSLNRRPAPTLIEPAPHSSPPLSKRKPGRGCVRPSRDTIRPPGEKNGRLSLGLNRKRSSSSMCMRSSTTGTCKIFRWKLTTTGLPERAWHVSMSRGLGCRNASSLENQQTCKLALRRWVPFRSRRFIRLFDPCRSRPELATAVSPKCKPSNRQDEISKLTVEAQRQLEP